MTGLTDWTGLFTLRQHTHVKITRTNHKHYGRTGTVVRIKDNQVWVALPGGIVTKASHRSLEVLTESRAKRKARGGR